MTQAEAEAAYQNQIKITGEDPWMAKMRAGFIALLNIARSKEDEVKEPEF